MNIKNIVVGLVVVGLGTWGSMGCAQTQETPQSIQVEKPASVEVGNKTCPVSGEKVGEMGEVVKYEYNGKIYNLCCPNCKKDFSENSEKYSKIAEDEVAAALAQPPVEVQPIEVK